MNDLTSGPKYIAMTYFTQVDTRVALKARFRIDCNQKKMDMQGLCNATSSLKKNCLTSKIN